MAASPKHLARDRKAFALVKEEMEGNEEEIAFAARLHSHKIDIIRCIQANAPDLMKSGSMQDMSWD